MLIAPMQRAPQPPTSLERLVFYGKGGIGKSTISANIAAILARDGKRVLHVGCDPKHDSTVALMGGEMIPTVSDRAYGPVVQPADIVSVSPRWGVHCAEAGGPQAGVGCAGRGITRMLEIFEQADLLTPARYDVASFDLLGDVVCGGFAAPLRHGVGQKVIIVSSEEVMSLYAANNIARAIVNHASNGIVCAGIVLNRRDGQEHAELEPARRFAELLGTRIISTIDRDPLVREAEYRRITVVEHAPDSALVAQLGELAQALVALDPSTCPLPTPLSDRAFYAQAHDKFAGPRSQAGGKLPTQPVPPLPSTPPADDPVEARRKAYQRDLRAGIAAVQRSLVAPEEAVARLQRTYPELTRSLQPRDLT